MYIFHRSAAPLRYHNTRIFSLANPSSQSAKAQLPLSFVSVPFSTSHLSHSKARRPPAFRPTPQQPIPPVLSLDPSVEKPFTSEQRPSPSPPLAPSRKADNVPSTLPSLSPELRSPESLIKLALSIPTFSPDLPSSPTFLATCRSLVSLPQLGLGVSLRLMLDALQGKKAVVDAFQKAGMVFGEFEEAAHVLEAVAERVDSTGVPISDFEHDILLRLSKRLLLPDPSSSTDPVFPIRRLESTNLFRQALEHAFFRLLSSYLAAPSTRPGPRTSKAFKIFTSILQNLSVSTPTYACPFSTARDLSPATRPDFARYKILFPRLPSTQLRYKLFDLLPAPISPGRLEAMLSEMLVLQLEEVELQAESSGEKGRGLVPEETERLCGIWKEHSSRWAELRLGVVEGASDRLREASRRSLRLVMGNHSLRGTLGAQRERGLDAFLKTVVPSPPLSSSKPSPSQLLPLHNASPFSCLPLSCNDPLPSSEFTWMAGKDPIPFQLPEEDLVRLLSARSVQLSEGGLEVQDEGVKGIDFESYKPHRLSLLPCWSTYAKLVTPTSSKLPSDAHTPPPARLSRPESLPIPSHLPTPSDDPLITPALFLRALQLSSTTSQPAAVYSFLLGLSLPSARPHLAHLGRLFFLRPVSTAVHSWWPGGHGLGADALCASLEAAGESLASFTCSRLLAELSWAADIVISASSPSSADLKSSPLGPEAIAVLRSNVVRSLEEHQGWLRDVDLPAEERWRCYGHLIFTLSQLEEWGIVSDVMRDLAARGERPNLELSFIIFLTFRSLVFDSFSSSPDRPTPIHVPERQALLSSILLLPPLECSVLIDSCLRNLINILVTSKRTSSAVTGAALRSLEAVHELMLEQEEKWASASSAIETGGSAAAVNEEGERKWSPQVWTSLMHGYDRAGQHEKGLALFGRAKGKDEQRPNKRAVAVFFDGCGFSGSSLDLAKSTWASLRSSSAQLEPNSWSAYIEALTRLGDLPTATLHQIRHPSTHSPSFPAPPLDLRGVALLIAQTRRMTRERKRHSLSPRDREGWERDLRTALGGKMERELDELMRSMFSQGARAPKSTSERRRLKKYDGGSSLLDCSDHMS